MRAPEAPELVAFRARVLVLRRTYAAAEARVIRCEEQCWTWEDILAYQQQHLGDAAGSSVFSSLQTSSSASLMSSSSSSSANAALRSPLLNYSDNDDHPNEAMTSSSSNMSDLLGGAGTSTSSGAAVNSPNIVWWDGTVSGPWATAWHTKWQQRAMKATAVFFGIGSFLVVLVELASLVDASTAASNGYGAIDGIGVEWFGGPTGCTVMVGVALLHVIATLTWATCAFAGEEARCKLQNVSNFFSSNTVAFTLLIAFAHPQCTSIRCSRLSGDAWPGDLGAGLVLLRSHGPDVCSSPPVLRARAALPRFASPRWRRPGR